MILQVLTICFPRNWPRGEFLRDSEFGKCEACVAGDFELDSRA